MIALVIHARPVSSAPVVVKTGEKRLAGGADDDAIREFASIFLRTPDRPTEHWRAVRVPTDRAEQIADCVSS